ncbi:MAG TPA: cytochrome c oxidase subunit II [Solirubrobacteraceae bacterium]|nr:cytochrome c oxidase subunit II [Solirubrobacteraceae bacterium]HUA49751.1 cytochrome c oxidase subunit II [Solirubrobacteraceae bacterium]
MEETHHWRNIVVLWLVASLIMTPIVIFVIGPGLPPGNGSVEASGQVTDNTVLLATATPVALAVLVYIAYACWAFRERTPEVVLDGPAIRGNSSVQFWWLIVTTTLVLFLAGYGTVRLLADGSGGGQGPNPIAVPSAPNGGKPLVVQVVAQQWQFNYRFPGYGGFETNQIELPENTLVQFNVTSLDVIHSFWAYELGVKADANPGVNNVAYVTTKGPLLFHVRCAELCGVWHGYMFDQGRVVPKAQFAAWIVQQKTKFAPATKTLPPYSKTYFPQPLRRGG